MVEPSPPLKKKQNDREKNRDRFRTFLNSFCGKTSDVTDRKFISLDSCVLLVSKYISSFSVGIFFPKDKGNLVSLNIFRKILIVKSSEENKFILTSHRSEQISSSEFWNTFFFWTCSWSCHSMTTQLSWWNSRQFWLYNFSASQRRFFVTTTRMVRVRKFGLCTSLLNCPINKIIHPTPHFSIV